MSDNKILKTYWEGKITNLEILAIKSYLANGHIIFVYTYPKYNSHIKSFHENMEIRDASEILSVEKRWKIKGMSTIFSDLFRYYLLYKTGGWWMDLDIVLLKPITTESQIVLSLHFSEKEGNRLSGLFLNAAPLKMPKGHILGETCIREAESRDFEKLNHADLGPLLIDKEVPKLKLEKYIVPPEIYSPIGFHEVQRVIEPGFGFDRITGNTVAIHLFNTTWSHGMQANNQINKNATYHPDCLYEWLKKKYDVS